MPSGAQGGSCRFLSYNRVVCQSVLEFAYEFSETAAMSSNGQRFGDYVRQWREGVLRWTQLEVKAAGGPSNSTQTQIEKGELPKLTNATAKKLDQGLQWEPGSAWRVWEGGEAVRRTTLLSAHVLAELERLSPGVRDQIRATLEEDARRKLSAEDVEGRREA